MKCAGKGVFVNPFDGIITQGGFVLLFRMCNELLILVQSNNGQGPSGLSNIQLLSIQVACMNTNLQNWCSAETTAEL